MSDEIEVADKMQGSNLTQNLKYLMQRNRLTSVELANKIGLSNELIGKLKAGKMNNPTLRVLLGISKYFNITIYDLVFEDLELFQFALKPINRISIINWKDIKFWNKVLPQGFIYTNKVEKYNTFAIQLDNQYGIFPANSSIFIDLKLQPKNNDYVLVLDRISEIFYFKRIIIEEILYLQSILMDINNVIKYDENIYLIYGVIVGYQKSEFFRG